ncbi:MAG: gfo/Idh/MocA family oxidoreductase, partial [Thermoprotei archaeon]
IKDRKPLISGIDGLRAIQIAEACWKSYKEQKPIKIEY